MFRVPCVKAVDACSALAPRTEDTPGAAPGRAARCPGHLVAFGLRVKGRPGWRQSDSCSKAIIIVAVRKHFLLPGSSWIVPELYVPAHSVACLHAKPLRPQTETSEAAFLAAVVRAFLCSGVGFIGLGWLVITLPNYSEKRMICGFLVLEASSACCLLGRHGRSGKEPGERVGRSAVTNDAGKAKNQSSVRAVPH